MASDTKMPQRAQAIALLDFTRRAGRAGQAASAEQQ